MQGDLATLELSDIIQNLEMHERSGTLEIESERGTSRVYFQGGAVALLASDKRPPLMEDVVRAGLVEEKTMANAKRPRWRRRRALTNVLTDRGKIAREDLVAFAERRLIEDVCEILALEAGTFTFNEGRAPGGVFDPEEKVLGLSLAAGPVLFEAARRKDHMAAARNRVASDATHYVSQGGVDPASFAGDAELAEELLAELDGTRSVRDLVALFPSRRFEAFEALAALVATGVLRPAEPEDLERMARELVHEDPDRALRVLRDALETTPHHRGLLCELANLSERRDDLGAAADALKVLAHLDLELGERERANENLNRACTLAPDDTSIRERRMRLAMEENRREDAVENGVLLVDLYRKPGLHAKAAAILTELVELDPDSWDLRRELARSQADCGNPTLAVAELRRFGKKLLSRSEDRLARTVQEEILALVPKHAGAKRTIELIDSEAFVRRRNRRRRVIRRALTALIAVPLGLFCVFDVCARLAYSRASREVAELELIETRNYGQAIQLYEDVRASYPFTLTAMLTVDRQVELLGAKSPED